MTNRRLSLAVLITGVLFLIPGGIQLFFGGYKTSTEGGPPSIPIFLLGAAVLIFAGIVGLLINRQKTK